MLVCTYARVSKADLELGNQTKRLREYCDRIGYEICHEYTDIGSGADPLRPQLNQMLRDASLGKFEKIVVMRVDRLARRVDTVLDVVEKLKRCNISIDFVDQPMDISTPSGMLTLHLLSAIGEFERNLIIARTRDGLERAKAEGKGKQAKTLSEDEIEYARRIIEDNPDISQRALASHFPNISRSRLTVILREAGVWTK